MNFSSAQTLVIPVTFLFFALLMLSIISFLYALYRREKEFERKQTKLIEDYDQIMQQAHAKAREIIDRASSEAQSLLSQTQESKSNVDQSVRDAFVKLTQDQMQLLHTNSDVYAKDYQTSLQQLKDTYTKSLEDLLKQIKEKTEQELLGSQQSMQKKIQDEFSKSQVEINEYKRHQMQHVDQSINDMVGKISEDVLGKAISLRDHQQLILQSLEQAKKEGMFET